MFTGIVEVKGTVVEIVPRRLTVSGKELVVGTSAGDSIAVNGVCLTVTSVENQLMGFDMMAETLGRTNLGGLNVGDPVNLERSLVFQGRIGGHLVQGHVEGVATVSLRDDQGGAVIIEFEAPSRLMKYIVEKGFISIDGVSLTVVKKTASHFSVSLVKYTLDHTNLGGMKAGDKVNLETDIIGRYVESILGGGQVGGFIMENEGG